MRSAVFTTTYTTELTGRVTLLAWHILYCITMKGELPVAMYILPALKHVAILLVSARHLSTTSQAKSSQVGQAF